MPEFLPHLDIFSPYTILTLVCCFFISIAIHEFGHMVSGRLSGWHVAGFGIGMSPQLVSVPCFGTRFFVSWPPSGGLTLGFDEEVVVDPRRMLPFLLGGPIADFFMVILLLGVWNLVGPHVIVAAAFYNSLLLVLLDISPQTFRVKGVELRSDCLQIAQILRGTWYRWNSPGMMMRSSDHIYKMSKKLDSIQGMVSSRLTEAIWCAEIGDTQSAAKLIDEECFHDPRRNGYAAKEETLCRAMIAIADNDDSASELIDKVRTLEAGNQWLIELSGLLEVERSLVAAQTMTESLYSKIESAWKSGHPVLMTAAQTLNFIANPPEDLSNNCSELLDLKGKEELSPFQKFQVAAYAVRGLQENDQDVPADLLTKTRELACSLAAEIPSEHTRRVFIEKHCIPLSKSLFPAFIDDGGTSLIQPPTGPQPHRLRWLGAILVYVLTVGVFLVLLSRSGTRQNVESPDSDESEIIVVETSDLIRDNPRDADLLIKRGDAYFYLGEFEQASADYSTAILFDPDNAEAYLQRGLSLSALERYRKAVSDYSQALDLGHPEPEYIYELRAIAYLVLGEKDKAHADRRLAENIRDGIQEPP